MSKEMHIIIYEDDGPSGFCGQDCATTCPWKEAHLFDDIEEARAFILRIGESRGRLHPRITWWFDSAHREIYDHRGAKDGQ